MHPIITNIINLFEATTHDLDELTARRQKKKKKKIRDFDLTDNYSLEHGGTRMRRGAMAVG